MIVIKQNNTRPAIEATLLNVEGKPVDLSIASVEFAMRRNYGALTIVKGAQQTGNPGEVWVVFEDGDTANPGLYNAEFTVTYEDGRLETFPHDGYIQIKIEERVV